MAEQSVIPAAGAAPAQVTPAPTPSQHQRYRVGYAAFLTLSPAWERLIALLIIVVQAFWAIAIPIKNVVMISDPVFRPDSIDTGASAYRFLSTESAPVTIPGKDIVPLLQKVLDVVIGQRVIRGSFESVGSFDLDTAHQLLSPEDFHTISQYYAMFCQATEFPDGVMTPRPQYFAESDEKLPQDALGVWIRPTDPSQSDWFLKLSCSAENAKLEGTRCFQGNTSNVCFDFPKIGEVRRYESVSLGNLRANTGLANNIRLLYLIEYSTRLNDSPVTACHRAFFKTLTKVAFLSLLGFSDLPSYSVFMSNVNGGANTWFRTTVHKTELYGEIIGGSRYAFSYTLDAVIRRNDGSAWVVVPLLHAMLQYFTRSDALQMLTVEFNRSFASLVATEHGLIHFSDMAQCKIGFAKNNVTDGDNTVEEIMDKLHPSVVSFFVDLLDAIPALHSRMKFDLESAVDAAPVDPADGSEIPEHRSSE